MTSFLCQAKTASGKPCRAHTHVLQETDVTDRPNNNRCNFCSVHCEKLKQFRTAQKRTQALFHIIHGAEYKGHIMGYVWELKPTMKFSHIDYTQYIKATDKIIEDLLQIESNRE